MKTISFPETVEFKSARTIIYRQKLGGGWRFEVRYHDLDVTTQRSTFGDYEAAKKFAKLSVHEISAARNNFLTLRGNEGFVYKSTVDQLRAAGLSLPETTSLWSNPSVCSAEARASWTPCDTLSPTGLKNLRTKRSKKRSMNSLP